MTMRLVVYNNSDKNEVVRLKCNYLDVEIEKGQTKTIEYHGDGEWEVEAPDD